MAKLTISNVTKEANNSCKSFKANNNLNAEQQQQCSLKLCLVAMMALTLTVMPQYTSAAESQPLSSLSSLNDNGNKHLVNLKVFNGSSQKLEWYNPCGGVWVNQNITDVPKGANYVSILKLKTPKLI